VGWRGVSTDGDRFVQRFPAWRDVDDLAWCDSVARAASSEASACVHAVPSSEGRTAIATADGPVMVFPFIDGEHSDVASIALQTAALLASIHHAIAST
jgi:hypothetical protein